jgi:hypothetical protein
MTKKQALKIFIPAKYMSKIHTKEFILITVSTEMMAGITKP